MEVPITSSEATSVLLRPTRSPKWPNTAEPRGRARKAMPKVRKALSDCTAGLAPGKNTGPITSAAAMP